MNNCKNCGLVTGVHGSILPGCTCNFKTFTPQRSWVGLTDDERIQCEVLAGNNYYMLCKIIEEKLKEKNLAYAGNT